MGCNGSVQEHLTQLVYALICRWRKQHNMDRI